MKRMKVALLVAIGLAAMNGSKTLAQFPYSAYGGGGNGVSASATESVSVKPDKLRLLMLVKAQGSDAKSALASMNEHKEFVKKELEGMKADKDKHRLFAHSSIHQRWRLQRQFASHDANADADANVGRQKWQSSDTQAIADGLYGYLYTEGGLAIAGQRGGRVGLVAGDA